MESPKRDSPTLNRYVFYILNAFLLQVSVVSRVMRKIDFGSGRNLLQGGGLTAPWLPISGQKTAEKSV